MSKSLCPTCVLNKKVWSVKNRKGLFLIWGISNGKLCYDLLQNIVQLVVVMVRKCGLRGKRVTHAMHRLRSGSVNVLNSSKRFSGELAAGWRVRCKVQHPAFQSLPVSASRTRRRFRENEQNWTFGKYWTCGKVHFWPLPLLWLRIWSIPCLTFWGINLKTLYTFVVASKNLLFESCLDKAITTCNLWNSI